MSMRILFMGTPDFAVASLKRLVEDGHEICGVFTQPDKPKNRGHKLAFSPVKEYAITQNLDVYQPLKMRDGEAMAIVESLAPEMIVVAAYGKKNGIMHTGPLTYKAVEVIPCGEWYTPQTAVVCDLDDTAEKNIANIEAICRQLMQFSEADSLDVSEDYFSFALNNLRIKDDAQLKLFMQLYAQLIELTDGECSLIGELADISVPDVRMIRFDVEANGTYTLEMAAI